MATDQTEQQTPTSAQSWKKKAAGKPLNLPSENTALVKRVKPEAFLSSGMIPDPLSGMVTKAINEKKGLPPSKVEEIERDPKMLASTMLMVDRVVCYVMIEPVAAMPPTCTTCGHYFSGEGADTHTNAENKDYHPYREGVRDPEVLYTDEIDLEDKLFIFNWCIGGTGEIARFREELQGTVDAVSERANVRVPSEPDAGA